MSRTTLDIEEPILQEIRRIQGEEGGSLGSVVTRLLADAIARRERPHVHRAAFRWNAKAMKARVAIDDKEALYAILDSPHEGE